MLNAIFNASKHVYATNNNISSRHFYRWIILMFNAVNKQRLKEVGPDRACAEWLLRNGASIQWKGAPEYLTDYNLLPPDGEIYYIQKIDATDSAIHHAGFDHFSGCNHIEEIKLVRCSYIEDDALPMLSIVNNSLKYLEVLGCKNITDEALLQLKNLKNLKTLKLGGMPYVKDKKNVVSQLTAAMPSCNISYIN